MTSEYADYEAIVLLAPDPVSKRTGALVISPNGQVLDQIPGQSADEPHSWLALYRAAVAGARAAIEQGFTRLAVQIPDAGRQDLWSRRSLVEEMALLARQVTLTTFTRPSPEWLAAASSALPDPEEP